MGRGVGFAVQRRARNIDQVRDLQRTSIDYYAAVRSLYRQGRVDAINNGEAERTHPAPTISYGSPLEDRPQRSNAGTE